ncbi:hypothetical protein PRIPAC_89287 [Pristionchus pacificus]|uniref:Uncharacterized protein n=1 Tax=Pristionchus pacificus TaxID=54126 RepID=A0A2A6B8N2_PRIPA|nr:hypothetical protein PRIPAC_89287 [Pristionchus pacificus]|eukprot:PDM62224.1 hypothetical protein PRIPAC_51666 [Pristionchus pacificus]
MVYDPNHPRFTHTLTCNAHVTKAARVVVAVSLFSVLIRVVIEVAMQTWDYRENAILAIDFCLSICLLVAVYKEIPCLIVPYLAYLVLNVLVRFIVAFQVVNGKMANKMIDVSTTSGKIFYCVQVAVLITILGYFFKVIFNFFVYLLGRVNVVREPHHVHCSSKYSPDPQTLKQRKPRVPPGQHLSLFRLFFPNTLPLAMSFDQNHPKYFHTLCVSAHVTKAARSIAVFSLISFVLRTAYFLATQYKEWDRYITFMFFLDFCCVVGLLAGVHKELLTIVLMIGVTFAIITEMPITAVFMGVIVIGFVAYFSKIVLNYFVYLSALQSHQSLSGPPSVSYHASVPSAPLYEKTGNQYPTKHQEAHKMEAGELPPPYTH